MTIKKGDYCALVNQINNEQIAVGPLHKVSHTDDIAYLVKDANSALTACKLYKTWNRSSDEVNGILVGDANREICLVNSEYEYGLVIPSGLYKNYFSIYDRDIANLRLYEFREFNGDAGGSKMTTEEYLITIINRSAYYWPVNYYDFVTGEHIKEEIITSIEYHSAAALINGNLVTAEYKGWGGSDNAKYSNYDIHIHDGISNTILNTFSFTSNPQPGAFGINDIAFDGTNLLLGGHEHILPYTGKATIYKMDGISSTIAEVIHAYTGSLSGLTYNGNDLIIGTGSIPELPYLDGYILIMDGISSDIKKYYSGFGWYTGKIDYQLNKILK